MHAVQTVTDQDFQSEVLKSPIPVLVDFTASWCGPCQNLAPTLEQIAEGRSDIKIVKIDVGGDRETRTPTNPATRDKYQIKSFPTLYLLRNGKIAAVKLGGGSKDNLSKWIDGALAQSPDADMDETQALAKIAEESEKAERAMNRILIPIIGATGLYKLGKLGSGATLAAQGLLTGQPLHAAVGIAAAGFSALDIKSSLQFKNWHNSLSGVFRRAAQAADSGAMLANGLMLYNAADAIPGPVAQAAVKTVAVISSVSGGFGALGLLAGLFARKANDTPDEAEAAPAPAHNEAPSEPVCKDGVCELPPPRP